MTEDTLSRLERIQRAKEDAKKPVMITQGELDKYRRDAETARDCDEKEDAEFERRASLVFDAMGVAEVGFCRFIRQEGWSCTKEEELAHTVALASAMIMAKEMK